MASKKLLQDMIPNKHSIRNVPIKLALTELDMPEKPEKKTTTRKTAVTVTESPKVLAKPFAAAKPSPTKKAQPKKSYRRSWMLATFVVLVACIGVIVAAFSLLFSKGTVVVKPKTVSVVVSTSQIAKLNAATPQLPYEIVTLSEEARADVPGVQSATIEKKATGTVVLYNALGAATQKIIAGTRLSNTKDLIYRTASEVIIPGQKTLSGKLVPGSVSVKVLADKAGVEYNSYLADLTGDFKVVAYQGTTKYSKIYARAKTDIVGGYSGKQVTPDKTARAAAEKILKDKLTARLQANSRGLIPKGYVTYDNANKMDFVQLEPTAQGTSTASVGIRATYTGYVFKSSDLVNSFAKEQIAQFPADGYEVIGLEGLEFKKLTNPASAASTSVSFSLKGDIKIVGAVPVDKLKKELAGIRVQDSGQIIRKYGTIGGAYAKISPVWMRSLPNDPDRITIEIQSDSKTE